MSCSQKSEDDEEPAERCADWPRRLFRFCEQDLGPDAGVATLTLTLTLPNPTPSTL